MCFACSYVKPRQLPTEASAMDLKEHNLLRLSLANSSRLKIVPLNQPFPGD